MSKKAGSVLAREKTRHGAAVAKTESKKKYYLDKINKTFGSVVILMIFYSKTIYKFNGRRLE